ncbi:MAG: hypothetical protein ACLP56_11190 [Candidatus Sulfotelmatobacter sp.]
MEAIHDEIKFPGQRWGVLQSHFPSCGYQGSLIAGLPGGLRDDPAGKLMPAIQQGRGLTGEDERPSIPMLPVRVNPHPESIADRLNQVLTLQGPATTSDRPRAECWQIHMIRSEGERAPGSIKNRIYLAVGRDDISVQITAQRPLVANKAMYVCLEQQPHLVVIESIFGRKVDDLLVFDG